MSRVQLVVKSCGEDVEAVDPEGVVHRVRLLAFEGPAPRPGEWLLVHSGYALERVETSEVLEALRLEREARLGLDRREAGGSK